MERIIKLFMLLNIKKVLILLILMAFVIVSCKSGREVSGKDKITVAAYYFPDYHTGDPRNNIIKGPDWSEWELVKNAIPRFKGHRQPNIPLWGYTDEKDPAVMKLKINAAADHGIDCFIFDWYMYEDGPFLNRCLDEGFLKAGNCTRIKFALMWANHDWIDIHPYTKGTERKLLYPGKISPQRFEEISEYVVNEYFTKPNYWKIDGKAYFSIYDIQKFIESFGSLDAARDAMNRMNARAIAAGLKGIHWNLVAWGKPVLPVEHPPSNIAELIKILGFDSATSYVWIHHVSLPETATDYNYVRDAYLAHWDAAAKDYGVPYIPNVTMGWDPSPRCDTLSVWTNIGYPFMNTIGNNTPENFENALKISRDKILADPKNLRILNINCWNEWTEGSYLEPDTRNGMAYLEAVKRVFR
jgi:hypothetical protein